MASQRTKRSLQTSTPTVFVSARIYDPHDTSFHLTSCSDTNPLATCRGRYVHVHIITSRGAEREGEIPLIGGINEA